MESKTKLVEPLDFRALLNGEVTTFSVDSTRVEEPATHSDSGSEDEQEIRERLSNIRYSDIVDEDTYEEGCPFNKIALQMFDLIPNGKIKKRIIREGDGLKPKENSFVRINYNAFAEFQSEPFDSTYARKRPHKFILNNGEVIVGLDVAVSSMRLNEKAQFLIEPEYAYGNCVIGRVPSNATVLFEVELLEITDVGAIIRYHKLPEDKQLDFNEILEYCNAINEKGKSIFKQEHFSGAIKEFHTALAKLKCTSGNNTDEWRIYRELMMKLLTNLLVCYSRLERTHNACEVAKEIYDFADEGNVVNIPIKVYFQHAKCLRLLSEYSLARDVLEKARKLEPNNVKVAEEFINLDRDEREHRKKAKPFGNALVGNRKS